VIQALTADGAKIVIGDKADIALDVEEFIDA
jgi:hypothetical protein